MSLQDPEELKAALDHVIQQLRKAEESLSPSQRRNMADDLSDVLSYVAAQVKKPSLTNVLYSQAANQARQKELFDADRKQRGKEEEQPAHQREFVESTFKNADQYLRTIQLGGYAAFFAIWGFTRTNLPPHIENISALLMTFSAVVFVGWELSKSSLLVISLNRHAGLGKSSLEHFVTNRSRLLQRPERLKLFLAHIRAPIWFVCVVPAVIAVGLLLVQFVFNLLGLEIPSTFLGGGR